MCFVGAATQAATVTFTANFGYWGNPNHWDTGSVPGPNDDVIIPGGKFITLPTAITGSVKSVQLSGVFNLRGTLNINNSSGDGFHVFGGLLANRGTININGAHNHSVYVSHGGFLRNEGGGTIDIGITSVNGVHIAAAGTLWNYGELLCHGIHGNYGIEVAGVLLNRPMGEIEVSNTKVNGMFITGTLDNFGKITIVENIGEHGIVFEESNPGFNRTGALLSVLAAGNECIILKEMTFTNESSAIMDITNCGEYSFNGYGLFMGSYPATAPNTIFNNHGKISIHDLVTNTNDSGLHLYGNAIFKNHPWGAVQIWNITQNGFYSIPTGTLENYENAYIQIFDIGQKGFYSRGTVMNEGGISIADTQQEGIYVDDGLIENYGAFQALDSGLGGVPNDRYGLVVKNGALLHNLECGDFNLSGPLKIEGELWNNGFFRTDGVHDGQTYGLIDNQAIFEDFAAGLSNYPGTLINNGAILDPTGNLTAGVSHPNFFDLGSISGWTVNGVYTDYSFNYSAGTYNAGSNSFVPSTGGAVADFLYLKITDQSAGCWARHRMDTPASAMPDPQEKSLSKAISDTQDLNVFPNPSNGTFVVEIEDPNIVSWQLKNALGQTILQEKAQGLLQQEIRFPIAATPGIYWLMGMTQDGFVYTKQLVLEQ